MQSVLNGNEEAAKYKIPFVVLDRPNPISGAVMEGPVPVRHGMTAGEVALMHKELFALDLDLAFAKFRSPYLLY